MLTTICKQNSVSSSALDIYYKYALPMIKNTLYNDLYVKIYIFSKILHTSNV